MILAIDWIRARIADPKNAWRQLLAEKAQLIFIGEEYFEASQRDEEEHKSAAKGADQESGEDDEVQELVPELGTQMTTLTMEGTLMETLQDIAELLEAEAVVANSTKILLWMMKTTQATRKDVANPKSKKQRVLDFYQTFNSQLLRWGVPEPSKLFVDYFSNAINDQGKASDLLEDRH